MKSALIGYTGFVGSNINGADDSRFTHRYNSSNIDEIEGQEFDLLVSAGFSAVKWQANQHKEDDWKSIESLLKHFESVRAKKFILISTVDVYPSPVGVDEDELIEGVPNEPYGENRLLAESHVRERFADHLIVRLPALFGKGLKKNVLFDLLSANQLESINPQNTYQYYDLSRIWEDLQKCLDNGVSLANFATPPIETREIITSFFPGLAEAVGTHPGQEQHYDIRTKHAGLFGGNAPYLYDKEESMARLKSFIESATRAKQ